MVRPPDTPRPSEDGRRGSLTSDLASRIARAQGAHHQADAAGGRANDMSMASRGFRLASEFVAAIVVGAALGYGIDLVLPTRPWGMVVFLLLGFAAGVLNVVRSTREMNAITPVPPGTPAVKDDEDDE